MPRGHLHGGSYQPVRPVFGWPWEQPSNSTEPVVRVLDIVPDEMVLVGWAKYDHDEFHDFRYASPGDGGRPLWPYPGYAPVFAVDPERAGEGGR